MSEFVFMALAFRGGERVPTSLSARLDKVSSLGDDCARLVASQAFLPGRVDCDLTRDWVRGDAAELTTVFRAHLEDMFSEVCKLHFPAPGTPVRICMEGVDAVLALRHCLTARSPERAAGGVEGDDLLLILLFERVESREDVDYRVEKRFPDVGQAMDFLRRIGLLSGNVSLKSPLQPGFYLLPLSRIAASAADRRELCEWLTTPAGKNLAGLTVAYLFYCWLMCLRCERLAASIAFDGDWDNESRKLILARKRLAVVWKYAHLKNRALPESSVLSLFHGVFGVFRLAEQLDNLSLQLDVQGKAMETQNTYVSVKRLRVIESILFLTAILGLGVATNAIQMPPFFDSATTNALERPIFWLVFAVVAAGAVVIRLAFAVARFWRSLKTVGRRIVRSL